jgi:hypothetical protein
VAGGVAAVAVVVTALLVLMSGGDAQVTSRTEGGIRWEVDGALVAVTVTDEASDAVVRRLRGRVVLGCETVGPRGDVQRIAVASGTAVFRGRAGTTRVRLSRRLERVDVCTLERPGVANDLASVRFRKRPKQDDQMLVIP